MLQTLAESSQVLGNRKVYPINAPRTVATGRRGTGWVQAQRKFMGRINIQGIHNKCRELDTGIKTVGNLIKGVKLRGGIKFR